MKKAWSRRTIDRLENGIIVLLVCTALFLVYQSGLVQNFAGQGAGTSGESVFTGVQNTALSRGTPVRLMVQLDDGRYGAQYDQTLVDQLYASGLSELLTNSIEAMESPRTVTQEVWQQAIAQSGPWVFYDFLYNVSFTAQSGQGEGAARFFLLTTRGGRADMVYYYNEETGDYYAGQIQDATLTLPASLDGLQPNGGQFVFEVPELAQVLAPYGILLDQPPTTTVYTAANPVASWGEAERTALLDALDFNTRALTIYESADGTVMQEGSDTLRIQEEGKIIYHASDSSQARFQALSQREKDLQIKAEEVLDLVTAGQLGEGRMFCQSIETLEDETVELTFCYLLDGAQVQLGEEGWGAQFVFSDSALTSFTICLRTYTATDRTQRALPERQAAAAVTALGQTGKELQLCYRDDDTTPEITADWTVRERS